MAFFFSCRPIAHLVIAEHESVRICVTGPGHQNQFHQWIRTPYFREEISVAFVTIYLQQQTKKYGNELWKDKAVLPLESAMEFIFNINKQQKQTQAGSPAQRQRLLCMPPNPARSAAPFTCGQTPESFRDWVSALNANSILLWNDSAMILLKRLLLWYTFQGTLGSAAKPHSDNFLFYATMKTNPPTSQEASQFC